MSGPCTYRNRVQVTQQLNYNNLGVRDGYIIKPKNTKEYEKDELLCLSCVCVSLCPGGSRSIYSNLGGF